MKEETGGLVLFSIGVFIVGLTLGVLVTILSSLPCHSHATSHRLHKNHLL